MGDHYVKVQEYGASTDFVFPCTFAASVDIDQGYIIIVHIWIEIEVTCEREDCEIEGIQRILTMMIIARNIKKMPKCTIQGWIRNNQKK